MTEMQRQVTAERSRPVAVWVICGLLTFLGLTALGGGGEMLLVPDGNQFVPGEWLDGIPLIDSWIVPGLVLGVIFGIGSLLTAAGLIWRPHWGPLRLAENWTGRHWAWVATLLLGVGLVVWIGLEVILIPERNVIEAVYGTVAVALIALVSTPRVRDYLARTPNAHLDQGGSRRASQGHE